MLIFMPCFFQTVCRAISGLLLYFLLASFGWMLMQGYCLYQMIILVFSDKGYLRTEIRYAISYLLPLVIIGVFVAIAGWKGLYDDTFGYL